MKNEETADLESNIERGRIRVNAYIPISKHQKLKSKLAFKGISISEWIRSRVIEYLEEED